MSNRAKRFGEEQRAALKRTRDIHQKFEERRRDLARKAVREAQDDWMRKMRGPVQGEKKCSTGVGR